MHYTQTESFHKAKEALKQIKIAIETLKHNLKVYEEEKENGTY